MRCVPCLVLALFAGPAWGGIDEELRSLINADRQGEARDLIDRVLGTEGSPEGARDDRAAALHWLGRLEVAAKNWSSARAAYERLAAEFGDTAPAVDAVTELALLRALLEGPTAPGTPAVAEAASASVTKPESEAPQPDTVLSIAAPAVPTDPVPKAAAATPAVTASGVLVGAFGTPFEAAEEAGLQVQGFLSSRGIASDFEATPGQALRGRDAVVGYLLTRVRDLGRSKLILVGSRWGFREFVEVEGYSPDGALLWREKVTGGRALRSEKVKTNLMGRLWPKLEPHVGPDSAPQ